MACFSRDNAAHLLDKTARQTYKKKTHGVFLMTDFRTDILFLNSARWWRLFIDGVSGGSTGDIV